MSIQAQPLISHLDHLDLGVNMSTSTRSLACGQDAKENCQKRVTSGQKVYSFFFHVIT